MVDVVGVGLNATDILIPVKDFPASGSKVEIHSASPMLGGQVASAMAACQQWGLSTRYVGKFGDDYFAQLHQAEFQRLGVETHLATAPGATSQQAYILVDRHGERTVLWKRDPSIALVPEELQQEWIETAGILLVDGHDTPAATQAARWARAANIPVVADLDELYPGVEHLLPNIDYLITSRDIPGKLTETNDLHVSLPELFHRYNSRLTAATLGSEGVLAYDGHNFTYCPAFQINAADTTGAGDTFHAAFIFGLRQAWPLERQLIFASAAAALNCTALGARGGIHSVHEIEHLIATARRHPAVF